MPPEERSRQLVYELDAWYRGHAVRQKDLAAELGLRPQQLSEILALRNRPTADQILRIQNFLAKENMKSQLVDPPAMPRASTRDPNEPRTLLQAKDQLENLRLEIAELKAAAASPGKLAPASPTSKPAMATPAPSPIKTGNMVANRGPAEEAPVKKALPVTADTPFLIQKILDVTNLDDLRLLLNNPVHTPIQQSCLYAEIQKRRALVSNRFQ